ncbi:MAG: hypothetical protein QOC77_3309 [Thermoleophilaceae bacterium]|jgi:hypothetical protein|nr:hypothetical protein [Thermoleophilaceae bacterium]MEA2470021.1 hypothetical protein [Thermoleophilaceae bacterium]
MARSPEEIRLSVETTRQELQYSLNDLQAKVSELTDWRSKVARHRKEILIGAAVAGFVIGGGIAGFTGIFRR